MAEQTKDPKSPATTSAAYDRMGPDWKMVTTLLGGTRAMREAGSEYLPQHPEESDENYQVRLQATTLLNRFEQTLVNLASKPFVKPAKTSEDMPELIAAGILPDVDLQGNNLDVFLGRWFKEGLAKAMCHVLVDFPRVEAKADGTARTLADDRAQNLRPYWVMIRPECVVYMRSETINGAEFLTHVRIKEVDVEEDGFADKTVERIRVLEPGIVRIYEKQEVKGQTAWVLDDEWQTGLDYIPLVTFYAAREELGAGKPPLMDLAHLNVAHWQSTSEQRHSLTVARFPILACSGASSEDSDPITIGPDKVLYNSDSAGRFYYVEHTGAGIEAGRKDLEDLERQMDSFGAEFLKDKPGTVTATARALDGAESTSDLAAMVTKFQDAVNLALDYTAVWLGLGDYGGTIELVKDWNAGIDDQAVLTAAAGARISRDISRKTYLDVLIARKVLPENFDMETDKDLLDEETMEMMGLTQMNLDMQAAAAGAPPADGSGAPPEDKQA